MSRTLFFRLIFITIPLLFNSAKSQPDHFAYAVTTIVKGGKEWVALRRLDTRTGEFGSILLNFQDKDQNTSDSPNSSSYVNTTVSNPVITISGSPNLQPAFGSSVAAIAYDRKTNRIYYAPMNIDQLHYIDLSTMESFSLPGQFFSKAGRYDFKNAGPISRMVIAPDDYGYTITNDGDHLIRFTTNGSPTLTDLGALLDDPVNKEMTIHSPCANSGGDLIADDTGHLYLITGTNKVFKVDIASRVTSYLATVSGLPEKFTTSGAAVHENGKQILVSSSVYSDGYFIIDPENWTASPFQATPETYESADLANSNILFSNNINRSNLFIRKSQKDPTSISVFPNPVLDDEVYVQFNDLTAGHFTIQLANLLGQRLVQQNVKITGSAQTEILHIPGYITQGFYYIQILDEKNNVVGTQKLIVERW